MVETEVVLNIWLTTVFGYGSKYPVELIEKYGSAYNVLAMGKDELRFGKKTAAAQEAFKNPDLTYAQYIYNCCKEDDIEILCYQDERYPHLLKEIPNPPAVLFYRGNIDLLNRRTFTVVGRRGMTVEGRRVLDDFVPVLQKAGFTIVAGFAIGAEAYMHRNFKNTVAVLPCGINLNYPTENAGLKRKIVENGGLVITEFMHDTAAYKGNFHLRNRILAGLSYGALVTQAGENSGTSITATSAGEFSRPVYVVPGSIYDASYRGSNEMIHVGATAVTSPWQIVAEYADIYEDIRMDESRAPEPDAGVLDLGDSRYDDLDDNAVKILKCISGERMHADEIAMRTGLNISVVNATLSELEMEDLVVRMDNNLYMLK
ncbi:MAG: DNA-processing protein DprA [Clostridia bacterium]|nr:DNA-processing protein DprA [Clostridia bacterium]